MIHIIYYYIIYIICSRNKIIFSNILLVLCVWVPRNSKFCIEVSPKLTGVKSVVNLSFWIF